MLNQITVILAPFQSIHNKILVYKYQDDIFRYYESRESQRLNRFDLELDAIFISVFINRAMWN